jgi:hypothetical protein
MATQAINPVPRQTAPSAVERYRRKAEKCERMAAETRDPDVRRWFLRAAEEWRRLLADNTISD